MKDFNELLNHTDETRLFFLGCVVLGSIYLIMEGLVLIVRALKK